MSNIYDYQNQTPPSGDGQNPPQPAQGSQGQGSDVAGMWRNWIGDPSNRAALMQFGISLMQPIAPGQSTLGHVGEAVGSAGEAVARKRAIDLKEAETASKMDLREAQIIRQEAGARELSGTAAAREAGAETRSREADIKGQQLTLQEALKGQSQSAALLKDYFAAKVVDPNLGKIAKEQGDQAGFEYYRKLHAGGAAAMSKQFQPTPAPGGGGGGPAAYPTGSRAPQKGDVVRGFIYNGGPLNDPNSWEAVKKPQAQ